MLLGNAECTNHDATQYGQRITIDSCICWVKNNTTAQLVPRWQRNVAQIASGHFSVMDSFWVLSENNTYHIAYCREIESLNYISVADVVIKTAIVNCPPPTHTDILLSMIWVKIKAITPVRIMQDHQFRYTNESLHATFCVSNLPLILHRFRDMADDRFNFRCRQCRACL